MTGTYGSFIAQRLQAKCPFKACRFALGIEQEHDEAGDNEDDAGNLFGV